MGRRGPTGLSSFLDDGSDEPGNSLSDPNSCTPELEWPFSNLDSLSRDDLRQSAYEIFFTSCRSSPAFAPTANPNAGRSHHSQSPYNAALAYDVYSDVSSMAGGKSPAHYLSGGTGMTAVSSKVKRALGLRTRRAAPMRVTTAVPATSGGGGGGGGGGTKVKQRPMTSAEIMRVQMGVTEHSDLRLRKTLARISQVRL